VYSPVVVVADIELVPAVFKLPVFGEIDKVMAYCPTLFSIFAQALS
jgi:hypothetical protein